MRLLEEDEAIRAKQCPNVDGIFAQWTCDVALLKDKNDNFFINICGASGGKGVDQTFQLNSDEVPSWKELARKTVAELYPPTLGTAKKEVITPPPDSKTC